MLFDSLKRQFVDKGLVGLNIASKQVNFAYISTINSKLTIEAVDNCSYDDLITLKTCLSQFTSKYHLENSYCNWVLSPNDYRLLLVDKPKVPSYEYQSAVKWQVKDMVDFPIDDMVTNIFSPAIINKSYEEKLYVVVARQSFLEAYAQVIEQSSLHLVSIDITELSILNLLQQANYDTQAVIILDASNEESILMMTDHSGSLYFTRRVPYGLKALSLSKNITKLTTEIGRSFDYCQNLLNQELPSKFIFSPVFLNHEKIVNRCIQAMNFPDTDTMNIKHFLNSSVELTLDLQSHCYTAIAGALREKREKP
ncbi:MAG: hypothetical protein JW855_01785 [Gammaproteobacteria bacterium]|nr:hypothetical protein [Gammaproteobacteria bacterium]